MRRRTHATFFASTLSLAKLLAYLFAGKRRHVRVSSDCQQFLKTIVVQITNLLKRMKNLAISGDVVIEELGNIV